MKKANGAVLIRLFWTMLTISACTFGGGFVIVSLMKKQFVDRYGWMDEQEMLDYTAIAQTCPGAIAVNAAILAGGRIAGWMGMVAAVLGTIIPPLGILSVISLFYNAFAENTYVAMALAGMQAGVAAVLCDVVLNLGKNVLKQYSWIKTGWMVFIFVAVYIGKVQVITAMLGTVIVGVVLALWQERTVRA